MNFVPIVCPTPLSEKSQAPTKRKRRANRTPADKAALVEKWRNSYASKTEFCRKHGLNAKTFATWVAQNEGIGENNKVLTGTARIESLMKKLSPDPPLVSCKICLPNQLVLTVKEIDLSCMSSLVMELSQCNFN